MVLPNIYTFDEVGRVVLELQKHLCDYGMLSLIDAYDFAKRRNPLLELPTFTYRDNTIGWDYHDVSDIRVMLVLGGVVILLPEPHVLDYYILPDPNFGAP